MRETCDFHDFVFKYPRILLQAIAIHTFVAVIWGKLGNNFIFAYCVVALNWLFVILFVALGLSLNKSSSFAYESPVGVSPSFSDERKYHLYVAVLVLDRHRIPSGAIRWRIRLDVDHDVCILHHVHAHFLVGAGESHCQPDSMVGHPYTQLIGGSNKYEWRQDAVSEDDRVSKAIPSHALLLIPDHDLLATQSSLQSSFFLSASCASDQASARGRTKSPIL